MEKIKYAFNFSTSNVLIIPNALLSSRDKVQKNLYHCSIMSYPYSYNGIGLAKLNLDYLGDIKTILIIPASFSKRMTININYHQLIL